MLFILGFLSGLMVSVLIILTLTYFHRVIEQKTTIFEKQIKTLGAPKPKGFIIEPIDEAEAVRQEIIAKNKQEGRPTTISELQ